MDIQKADEERDSNLRRDIVERLMRFFETDTLLCWAPERSPGSTATRESLRSRQMRVCRDITGYLTARVWPGVEIRPTEDENSILPATQPEMTKQVIKGWLHGLPAFELAAMERAVLASKSLLVAARLIVEWSQHFASIRGERVSEEAFGIKAAAEAMSIKRTCADNSEALYSLLSVS
jgi:ATP synthase F1 complex assembly factor 2